MIMVASMIQFINEALILSNYHLLVLIMLVLALINFRSRCMLIRACL